MPNDTPPPSASRPGPRPTVEVFSDVLCPWCYIGKRRLETALSQFPHREHVDVLWRSFELDPAAKDHSPGTTIIDVLLSYGAYPDSDSALRRFDAIAEIGEGEGLALRTATALPANSFDAHRLIHFAAAREQRDAMKERLLRAHHVENLRISDTEVLVRLATEIGLDRTEANAALADGSHARDVRADEERAAAIGARAVPTFHVSGIRTVSGVPSVPDLLGLLHQAWAHLPSPDRSSEPLGGPHHQSLESA